MLYIHTDGGARGNPGPAAIGVVIEKCICIDSRECSEHTRERVAGFGKVIGETTNNIAEYTAVIEALSYMKTHKDIVMSRGIRFFLDSTLVVNQLNGVYKIKEPHLREMVLQVHMLEAEVNVAIQYTYVPREQNTAADLFVNQALDAI